MGVILDSSAVIAGERKGQTAADLLAGLRQVLGPEPLALSTVCVVELEHGVWRAKDAAQANRRRQFFDDLFAAVPSYPLTFDIARRAARIDAEARRKGVTIPFQDLVIGATALEFGYAVATLNVRHFGLIPNLTVKPL
jgi:predicted nucleic acid-binding protein